MARIKIRTTCITRQFGPLSTGDVIVCSDEFARHMIDDCKAADAIPDLLEEMPPIIVPDPAPKRQKRV